MAGEIVVFAIYPFARNVERAINSLTSANIDAADISGSNGSRSSPTAPSSYLKDMGVLPASVTAMNADSEGRNSLGRSLFDV